MRRPGERRDDGERDHRADHHDLAVREVDELDDAVDHRVAERDHGVDAAERQAVDHLLQENVQATLPGSAPRCAGSSAAIWTAPNRGNSSPGIVRVADQAGNPDASSSGRFGRPAACRHQRRVRKTAPRRTPLSSVRNAYFLGASLAGAIAGAGAGGGGLPAAGRGAPSVAAAAAGASTAELGRLAGLDDGDGLDVAVLHLEDRHFGVLAVALLVELDVAGRAVELDLADFRQVLGRVGRVRRAASRRSGSWWRRRRTARIA